MGFLWENKNSWIKKNIINKRFLQNKSIDHWVRGEGWDQHAGDEVKAIYAKNVEEEGQ